MRLLTLLFAFYVACLACLPCTDEVVGCVEQTTQTTIAAHSDCGRADFGDWCSPLCQCHCCAGAVVPPAGASPLGLAPPARLWTASQRYAPLPGAAPTHPAGAVWQPPRA